METITFIQGLCFTLLHFLYCFSSCFHKINSFIFYMHFYMRTYSVYFIYIFFIEQKCYYELRNDLFIYSFESTPTFILPQIRYSLYNTAIWQYIHNDSTKTGDVDELTFPPSSNLFKIFTWPHNGKPLQVFYHSRCFK